MAEWNNPEDFPEVLSKRREHFSVDVLIYSPKTKEHTIGWFNFDRMTWNFLCREAVEKFKWRYFDEKKDLPPNK